jgi:prolyl-tRNA editing enzyme YbaK/EbsC (Cys-tRNA(Pro) deacylase)
MFVVFYYYLYNTGMASRIGNLDVVPAGERPDLIAEPVRKAISLLDLSDVLVAAIDPKLSDTAAFCEYYNIPMGISANCIILEATRAERTWLAACLVLATTRADVNGIIRRMLDARRVSFAPQEKAVLETAMEYGAITPIGLPEGIPVLIDSQVIALDRVVLGSGVRGSKLFVPGSIFQKLPQTMILENLGKSAT